MADILEEIVAYKKDEVNRYKRELSQVFLESRAEIFNKSTPLSMSAALRASKAGIIAEFKRKSPSKGWINKDASAGIVPLSYQKHDATAISILTDRKYFGGSIEYIRAARASKVSLPILFKNFIIDEYQLYQAKVCGASAVLLIAACLTREECKSLITKSHELGLEVLLEMHSEEELSYADLGADMCGINNRNLGTFEVDVNKSFQLVSRLPADAIKVSESGISDPNTVRQLKEAGFQGFLIGECFMREADPGEALARFIAQI